VTGTVIDTMDRMVIAAVLGPGAVTQYAVPYQLAARVTVVPTAVATTLFPRFSRCDDPDLSARAFEALRALMTPLIIAGLFLVGPFLRVWIGLELAAVAAPLGCIFLVGVWAAGLAQVPLTTIMGSRNPRVLAVNYLAQLLPYLGLMILLTLSFGLVGAATAWLLRAFADCAALCWLAGIARRAMTSSALPLFLVALASLLALELVLPTARLAAAVSLVALSMFIGRHQLAMLAGPVLAKIRPS
jgi:O-antigen/teichoic acid export membrane protein